MQKFSKFHLDFLEIFTKTVLGSFAYGEIRIPSLFFSQKPSNFRI